MNEQNILCIYHGNCADGFGAAWAVRKRFPKAEFYAGTYQNPPPDVAGRDVVFVDFSYKEPVLLEMAKTARSIFVLDHHKSAEEDLQRNENDRIVRFDNEFVRGKVTWERVQENVLLDINEGADRATIYAYFDMNRSGAGLAWDFFHPDVARPALINHIEDRDLWRFKLDGTKEIQSAVFSYPYDFTMWDKMMGTGIDGLYQEGVALERKHMKDIHELLPIMQRDALISGHLVPIANLPYIYTSEAGHIMSKGRPFAACYYDTPDGRVYSLRSSDEGEDVSAIAEVYGGGGHRNAAGFKVPFDHPLGRI